eukprot:6209154-Pleurochrysis_carterae.AAC.6
MSWTGTHLLREAQRHTRLRNVVHPRDARHGPLVPQRKAASKGAQDDGAHADGHDGKTRLVATFEAMDVCSILVLPFNGPGKTAGSAHSDS